MSTSSIAILKPDHLGDLVLSVPAIRAVRARYRNITLFVASSSRPLAGFLFPEEAGAVYLMNDTRDGVTRGPRWGEVASTSQAFALEDCWAMRRGTYRPILRRLASWKPLAARLDRYQRSAENIAGLDEGLWDRSTPS